MKSTLKTVLILVPLTLVIFWVGSNITEFSSSREKYEPFYSNRIILIRHAEKGFTPNQGKINADEGHSNLIKRKTSVKNGLLGFFPPWGGPPRGPPPKGKFPNGLSEKGKERAQYIRTLFGNNSEYDFGLIFAAPWDADQKDTERTYATVAPLAKDLNLTVNIECANSEKSCIVEAIEEFAAKSDKDILISWKHFELNKIAQALGAKNARSIYPDERNDVIWIMRDGQIVEKRSMHCPKLDDGRIDQNDPDLVVEEPYQYDGLTGVIGRFMRAAWKVVF
ncbi:uncharacterized protein I206_104366 [Kwoniella pini CBS 10737]|uniref:Histidine phosphatase family protein n=1 Tax=Kwoniella pini CBS 10737 TaxID=1296096 RepID=A0A1B9I1Y2_9TREE|nr:uncharacterized protein I206_04055 [Kwoniella pini CBS 10737]OCF49534.1 hypothetical protein I206_04055 [Kwoniella pini CBS 10737]